MLLNQDARILGPQRRRIQSGARDEACNIVQGAVINTIPKKKKCKKAKWLSEEVLQKLRKEEK